MTCWPTSQLPQCTILFATTGYRKQTAAGLVCLVPGAESITLTGESKQRAEQVRLLLRRFSSQHIRVDKS